MFRPKQAWEASNLWKAFITIFGSSPYSRTSEIGSWVAHA